MILGLLQLLSAEGDDRLKGTLHLWRYNPDNLDDARWASFESLRRSTLKTARAWSLKELAMSLWDYRSRGWAKRACSGSSSWRRWC